MLSEAFTTTQPLFIYEQGEKSFFLLPGEHLEAGIQDVFILGEDEGLILRANESFVDKDGDEVSCLRGNIVTISSDRIK